MKFVIILSILSCLLWECQSSPVQIVEKHQLAKQMQAVAVPRQSSNAIAPPAASSGDDDDDDDDDEDDIEALVDDDDDDDDDDEEEDVKPQGQQAQQVASSSDTDDDDDDEDDYLERLFDDILEDDDDDDDEDNIPASGAVAQPAAAAATVAQPIAASVAEPAITGDVEGLGNTAAVQSADYPAEGEQTVFYDEDNGGIDTKVDIQSLNKPAEAAASNPSNAVVQKITAAQTAQNEISSDSASDDDDDDEDDITGALDDDDEEDDEEDDDDEDDLIGEGVIEARRTRALEKQANKEPTMPDVLTERYNHFVDGIFDRINRILKTSYNPVRVRLAVNNNNNKKGKAKHVTRRKSISKQVKARTAATKLDLELSEKIARDNVANSKIPANEPTKVETVQQSKMIESDVEERIVRGVPHDQKQKPASNANTANQIQAKKANSKPIKPKVKQSGNISGFQSNEEKTKRAQGTLFGLASLQRTGNVKVIPDGNNSTVKAKFTLGPLTLRVEKSFRRGSNRSVKSATAKTNEINGRITLRVIDGAATLASIKVQQPKQVQVDSSDNHDRTREFVWKRTPLIAHVVSDKLKLVVESMLQPVGSQVVHL